MTKKKMFHCDKIWMVVLLIYLFNPLRYNQRSGGCCLLSSVFCLLDLFPDGLCLQSLSCGFHPAFFGVLVFRLPCRCRSNYCLVTIPKSLLECSKHDHNWIVLESVNCFLFTGSNLVTLCCNIPFLFILLTSTKHKHLKTRTFGYVLLHKKSPSCPWRTESH